MIKSAYLSEDRQYRYSLIRDWSDGAPLRRVAFIGLNPSTADENTDDPTIRKCISFARSWGFGSLVMLNVYALRATDPQAMLRHPYPTTIENDNYIASEIERCARVVACWGNHANPMDTWHLATLIAVRGIPSYCFGLTKRGAPKHPLYLPYHQPLQAWP
jgi:hypothetical protein